MRNVDKNERSPGGFPLDFAAIQGNAAMACLLLEHGADVNAVDGTGRTALMDAAAKGHTDIAKILLEYGADASMADDDGNTALRIAKLNRRKRIVEMLQGL